MIRGKKILILGGTGDARELAARVAEMPGMEVITSLAGRTRQPAVVLENTRVGGFDGVVGLTDYLRQHRIDRLIDATHPFAAQISFNAATAAAAVGIPHLMLLRPPWKPELDDRWIDVNSYAEAATVLPELARRIFLTIGRLELSAFAHLRDLWFLMRMVDPPGPDVPTPPGTLLLERGPFSLENERSLLREYEIGAIVSKNSGGGATFAKILAARELQLPVVMVQRPPMPPGEQVGDIESACAWLLEK